MGTGVGEQIVTRIGRRRVIEFLVPRDGAFGGADVADFVGFDSDAAEDFGDEPPRSRWVTALAMLGVAALFGGGILAAAPWDDDPASTPPTTALETTGGDLTGSDEGAPAMQSAVRGVPDGLVSTPAGWVLDDPGRFVVTGAGSNGSFVGPGDGFDLWLNSVASRTTGAYIAIDSRVWFVFDTIREGAVRFMAGDRPALVWTAPDGVIEIQVTTGNGGFVVTSGGVGLSDLVTIASTLTVDATDRGVFDYHGLDAADEGPFTELIRVVNGGTEVYPGVEQVGTALSWTSYLDPRQGDRLELRVLTAGRDEQLINDLVLSRPLPEADYGRDDAAKVDRLFRSGRHVQLRITMSGSDRLIARMQLDDGTQLMVTGDVEPHELLDIMGRIQPATDDAWRALLLDTMDGGAIDTGATADSRPLVFSGASSNSWQAVLYDGRFEIDADHTLSLSKDFLVGAGPELVEYRTTERSFLRATTTVADSARSIVVTQQGRDAIAERLIEVDRSGVFVTVLELDATLPYSVQWLDDDGTPAQGPTVAAP